MIHINKNITFKNHLNELHRENGPAFIDGDYQTWHKNGKLHRLDGPAFIDGDYQAWYLNGNRHRLDGPAVIRDDYQKWYLNGIKYDETDYNTILRSKNMITLN